MFQSDRSPVKSVGEQEDGVGSQQEGSDGGCPAPPAAFAKWKKTKIVIAPKSTTGSRRVQGLAPKIRKIGQYSSVFREPM